MFLTTGKFEPMTFKNDISDIISDDRNITENSTDNHTCCESLNDACLKHDCIINQVCSGFLLDSSTPNKYCTDHLPDSRGNNDFNILNLEEIPNKFYASPVKSPRWKKSVDGYESVKNLAYSPSANTLFSDISAIGFDIIKSENVKLRNLVPKESNEILSFEGDLSSCKKLNGLLSVSQLKQETWTPTQSSDNRPTCDYDVDRDLVLELDEKLCISSVCENGSNLLPDEVIDIAFDEDNCPIKISYPLSSKNKTSTRIQRLDNKYDYSVTFPKKSSGRSDLCNIDKNQFSLDIDGKVCCSVLKIRTNSDITQQIHLGEENCKKPTEDSCVTTVKRLSTDEDAAELKKHQVLAKKSKLDEGVVEYDENENGTHESKKERKRRQPVLADFKEKLLKCGLFGCSLKFSSEKSLKEHMRCHDFSHYSRHNFECYFCNQHFSKWVDCSMHLWNSHNTDVDLLLCGICLKYRTNIPWKMVVHQESHFNERLHKCEYCGKGFNQRSQIHDHVCGKQLLEEKPLWARQTLCKLCNKWFSTYRTYILHHRSVHMKMKRFSCPVCNYQCYQKVHFSAHMRTHTMIKPYVCELCDLCVSDHNSFRKHCLTHIPERKLRCPAKFCCFSTVNATFYRKHVAQHTSRTLKFICQICSISKSDVEEYLQHKKSHDIETLKSLIEKSKEENGKKLNNGNHFVSSDSNDELKILQNNSNYSDYNSYINSDVVSNYNMKLYKRDINNTELSIAEGSDNVRNLPLSNTSKHKRSFLSNAVINRADPNFLEEHKRGLKKMKMTDRNESEFDSVLFVS